MEKRKSFMPTGQQAGDYISLSKKNIRGFWTFYGEYPYRVEYNQFNDDWAIQAVKKIIKEHVNADKHDVIILDGFGMTSVVNKLQRLLGLRVPEIWRNHLQL